MVVLSKKEVVMSYSWDECPKHIWRDVEDMSGRGVVCTQCSVPGERDIYNPEDEYKIYFPAT